MPTVIRGSISDIEKALYEARAEGQKDIIKEFESKIITIETDTGGTFTGICKVIIYSI